MEKTRKANIFETCTFQQVNMTKQIADKWTLTSIVAAADSICKKRKKKKKKRLIHG